MKYLLLASLLTLASCASNKEEKHEQEYNQMMDSLEADGKTPDFDDNRVDGAIREPLDLCDPKDSDCEMDKGYEDYEQE